MSSHDTAYLLQLLAEKHGFGYSDDLVPNSTKKVGALQAHLSMMGTAAKHNEKATEKPEGTDEG